MLSLLAKVMALPAVADWLICRAQRTPYFHIKGDDGSVYMERYWLFNPYPTGNDGGGRRWGDWMPSIRIHRIMREDRDRHLHDHPWNARTFILQGAYWEVRLEHHDLWGDGKEWIPVRHFRNAGDTAKLRFGEYHRIARVTEGGVWTMFVTWRKRGTWGFMVGGTKVPWRTYLGIDSTKSQTNAKGAAGQEGA